MESPPRSSDFDDDELFDPSKPLQGVVVCCTSIPANDCTQVANKVAELGGRHEYDLTPKTTHLVVGAYETTKYKYVAKQRPDVQQVAIGWIDALRDLWIRDEAINFRALEKQWTLKTFETGGGAAERGYTTKLRLCMSGIDEVERKEYVKKIEENGGEYNGNLDKVTTHLVVQEPTGKKYLAARKWGIKVVAKQWIDDCIKRGMILDETYYDPSFPPRQLGQGAWINREVRRKSLGKRLRETVTAQGDGGRRKIRKAASMKLSSQRENMWGQILGQPPSAEQSCASFQGEQGPTQPMPNDLMLRPPSESVSHVGESSHAGMFASCSFCVFGFPPNYVEILVLHITSRDGTAVASPEELRSDQSMVRRFVVVPQESDPITHPLVPEGVDIVTDFFIEKCVHRKGKAMPDPKAHVIGRPFPVFPIEGFDKLLIATGGFTEVDLLHVSKAVPQLGARYVERFTAESSMLMCSSVSAVRKQKLDAALIWGVPVVKADWLWACISQGKRLPTKDFLFPELRSRLSDSGQSKLLSRSKSVSDMTKKATSATMLITTAKSVRKSLPGPDMAAFDASLISTEPPAPGLSIPSEASANQSQPLTQIEIASMQQPIPTPTPHQLPSQPGFQTGSVPLAERSASRLNKSASKEATRSPRKSLARIRSEICDSEAEDGESLDDLAPAAEDADPFELEKRRQAQENSRRDAAVRLDLSNKLKALLEESCTVKAPTNAANTGSFESTVSAAAPADGRRKRKLMGRAPSAASMNGSQDSSRGGGWVMVRTHSAALYNDDDDDEVDDDDDVVDDKGHSAQEETMVPQATQIQYDDPEATRSKARLVKKMLGRESPGSTHAKASSTARAKVEAGRRSMRRR